MSRTYCGADARLDLNLADPPTALADEVTEFVLTLTRDYRVPALASLVRDRLQRWENEQDESRATMLADVDPEDVF